MARKNLMAGFVTAGILFTGGAAQAADLQGLINSLGSIDFRLEDDSIELHAVDLNGNGLLDVGDTLRGIAEFTAFESNDGNVQEPLNGTTNTHISAIFEAEVTSKVAVGGGDFNFTFGPSGNLGDPNTMIAIYEDDADNLTIFNCGSVAACEAAVTDGTLIHQLGMDGSPGEFWVATGAPDDTSAGQNFPNTANLGDFNFFLSTISTSLIDPTTGNPLLAPWQGSGSIQGVQNAPGVRDNWDFIDDAQIGPVAVAVPEPGTLGLFGFGFAALGLMGLFRRAGRN
jgi:hypothetical protein